MNLNDDLLLLIFNTVATSKKDYVEKRQTTIRYASQVCRRWRELLLAASYIWGRLVWINLLQKSDWMEEVLERAKSTSFLSMTLDTSRVLRSGDKEHDFISLSLRILKDIDIWGLKLEELTILVARDYHRNNKNFYNSLCDQLQKPAKNLRTFTVYDPSSCLDHTKMLNLFNNIAPSLQNFSCTPHRCIPSQHSSSWLSHITTLRFCPSFMEDILDAVTWAQCLRILRIDTNACSTFSSRHNTDVEAMSSAVLQRLAMIKLRMWIGTFNALWSSRFISPVESYSVIYIDMDSEVASEEHDELERSKFLVALSNFFYHHEGITISNIHKYDLQWLLVSHKRRIQITVTGHPSHIPEPVYMRLVFHLGDGDPNNFKSFLTHSIAEYIHGTKDFYFTPMDCLHSGSEAFDFIVSSLDAVESLSLDTMSLVYYDRLEQKQGSQQPLLFPKLLTVCYMHYHSAPFKLDEDDVRRLRAFLLRREHAGRPVSATIDLVGSEIRDEIDKICRTLHGLSGLRITWRRDYTETPTLVEG
ncbi:hypothetical protein D9613_008249 [Agrocybe pediades]|uniref:F-box domain-containing protein n=1 Tax=Agrocybe pediades TaxID=84607 RepID=A0A8H4VNF6_9AGAR|nr:hypothetical protein D9613_008249 [Agrocybe pediades]